jgi:hypothetical protein
MTATRREPGVERSRALQGLRGAALYAALAAAVWWGAERAWPDEWLEPDVETRDRIVRIAAGALAAVAAWCLGVGLFHVARWARASRWERMLDDPVRAHLVPPLKSHADSVAPAPGGCGLALTVGLLGLGGVGLVVYGTLALADRVTRVRSDGEDQSATMLVAGIVLLWISVVAARKLRRWRVARRVEQLSNDRSLAEVFQPDEAAPVSLAAEIPDLAVRFDPVVHPLGGRNAPPEILYLRLFDNVRGTDRFVKSSWRRLGYVHILRSATQVEEEELDAAEDSRSLSSLFIATPEELDDALRRQATGRIIRPRPDGWLARWRWAFDTEHGRYPVRALLCHGSFWKTAVDLLLERMDLVVIDLTGYRQEHAGTRYELQRVIDRYPIDQVTLLAAPSSDQRFLVAQITSMWRHMADGSPNAGTGSRTVQVIVG